MPALKGSLLLCGSCYMHLYHSHMQENHTKSTRVYAKKYLYLHFKDGVHRKNSHWKQILEEQGFMLNRIHCHRLSWAEALCDISNYWKIK